MAPTAKKLSNPPVLDFEDSTLAPQSGDTLKRISALAVELIQLEAEVEEIQDFLRQRSDRITTIENELLPALMIEAGMKKFALEDGSSVEVKPVIRGSIPSSTSIESSEGPDREALIRRRTAALDWLREHNAGDLIKNKLTAEFGKGQDSLSRKIVAVIRKLAGDRVPMKVDETVHPQTLNSFLREQMSKGTDVPAETFAIWTGNIATLKLAKEKGPGAA